MTAGALRVFVLTARFVGADHPSPLEGAAVSLPDRAISAVTAHGLPTGGLVPHFLTRARWSRKLINLRRGRAVRLLGLNLMRPARSGLITADGAYLG